MEVPSALLDLWNYAQETSGQVNALASLKGILTRAQEGKNKVFAEVNFSSAQAALEQAKSEWERCIPYAVCPTCNGVTFENCTACKGRGFVSSFFWKNCVDEQTKALRAKLVE